MRGSPKWIVVRLADDEDSVEAHGPFTSRAMAEGIRDSIEELGIHGGYGYAVVELSPVREIQAEIRRERDDEAGLL